MQGPHPNIPGIALWIGGCALVLAGTLLPYAEASEDDDDLSILDFSQLDTTWPFALTFVVAIVAVPVVALLVRGHPHVVGGFLCGLGLVVFLDFLGAYVIGPSTYGDGYNELRVGPVLGAIGGALIVASGVAVLAGAPTRTAAMPAEPRTDRKTLPAWLPWVVIAAVAANSVLGILAIVFGDFSASDELAVKLLGSSLSITAAALLVISCGAAYVRASLRLVPMAGAALALAGFTWLVVDIWAQPDSSQPWKAAATLVITALGCSYASLLSLARRAPPDPAGLAALVSAVAFTVGAIAAVWSEPSSGQFWRLFGVLGLLLAALTVVVVVLGRVRLPDGAAGTEAT